MWVGECFFASLGVGGISFFVFMSLLCVFGACLGQEGNVLLEVKCFLGVVESSRSGVFGLHEGVSFGMLMSRNGVSPSADVPGSP